MDFSVAFRLAVRDYLYFLENTYPQGAVLKLVGDRYALSGTERTVLYRGIHTQSQNNLRYSKLLLPHEVNNRQLSIDALNVILTIGSYLNGNLVFISSDGFLRDASEIHGKAFRKDLLKRSVKLTLDYLKQKIPGTSDFMVDALPSQSKFILETLNNEINNSKLHAGTFLHEKVDHLLAERTEGILCTSDSVIIERAEIPSFDLARHCLEYHFQPDFTDLRMKVAQ